MRIVDVPTGEWFMNNGGEYYYIKTDPFMMGGNTYQAVNLVTGDPAFVARTSSADSLALSDADVRLINKPAMTHFFL